MRALLSSAALGLFVVFPYPSFAASEAASCSSNSDGYTVNATCAHSAAQTTAYVVAHSDHTFQVHEACTTDNATCPETPTCDGGLVYDIWEDGELLPWQACLGQDQANRINGLTPGFVRRAFRRLTWPSSALVVQPPHGTTLVNFETNFYTTNDHPTVQTVTLLRQRVTIEATPTRYTWHFETGHLGAAGSGLTTSDPGAPYPDLQVSHRYTRVGRVRPSVDTTYSGRFRVNGGDWQTIPDTVTVPGSPVDLEVVSATPHLVGY
jgi:hypothetical protein